MSNEGNNIVASNIKVFDFFSGCGGTSEGLRQAGMEIVLGIDNDKDSSETFQNNFNKHFPNVKFINKDIRKIRTEDIGIFVEKYKNNNDLILFCGCAPCQPFSAQNKIKDENDSRIDLLIEFARFVEAYLPDFIFCENVPGMQNVKSTDGPLTKFIELLQNLGYFIQPPRVVRAEKYGVPQRRKRLILIASRLGAIKFPEETHGNESLPYKTVREAFQDIPSINAGDEHTNKVKYPNHRCAGLNELNLKRIKSIKEGQGRKDWPKKYQLNCHKNYDGHSDVYGRLKWNEPSVTLTTRCTSISNGRFGHPVEDRALSVREAACLQTFPKDFVFFGSGLGSMARQVGNAVPVALAKIFGKSFVECAKLYLEAERNGKV